MYIEDRCIIFDWVLNLGVGGGALKFSVRDIAMQFRALTSRPEYFFLEN